MTSHGNSRSDTDRLAEYTDEQLVSLCRSGNAPVQYLSELVYRYYGFIKSKASVFCSVPASYDDFVQEGLLGFMNAVKSYDEGRKVHFSSYAYICVLNSMKTAARKLSRLSESEEGSENEHGEDTQNPESIIIQREAFGEMCDVLTEYEYNIFMMFIKGLSYEEIAQRLNITPKSADNAVARARRKLRIKYSDCSK